MGTLSQALIQEDKFGKQYRQDSTTTGEHLAQAALSTEYYVLDLANTPDQEYNKYIGRSQFPQFVNNPISSENGLHHLYRDKELDCLHVVYSILTIITRLMNKHKYADTNQEHSHTYIRRLLPRLSCPHHPTTISDLLRPTPLTREDVSNVCAAAVEAIRGRAAVVRSISSYSYKKMLHHSCLQGVTDCSNKFPDSKHIFLV